MDAKDQLIQEQAAEIKRLCDIIVQLQEEIARLKKDSNNSSKPASSDIVKLKKIAKKISGKKRNRGGQHGHRKFSRTPFEPEQIDTFYICEFVDKDAKGLVPLNAWFTLQQIELPETFYQVIEYHGRKYRNPVNGKIHIAMPDDVRKGSLLGASMTALVSFLKGSCHMSYTTIQQFFKQVIKLDISRGMLCKAVSKTSDALEPSYEEITERVPHEPQVNVDETGNHDNGKLHWTWCFDTADYSLFKMDPSRGSGVLEEILDKTVQRKSR